jgi:hypothetical protein
MAWNGTREGGARPRRRVDADYGAYRDAMIALALRANSAMKIRRAAAANRARDHTVNRLGFGAMRPVRGSMQGAGAESI